MQGVVVFGSPLLQIYGRIFQWKNWKSVKIWPNHGCECGLVFLAHPHAYVSYCVIVAAPLKLRPYGAIQICLLLLLALSHGEGGRLKMAVCDTAEVFNGVISYANILPHPDAPCSVIIGLVVSSTTEIISCSVNNLQRILFFTDSV